MCVFKDGREFEGIAVLTINDKFYGLAIINEFIINPDLHTAPKQSIIKSLQIRSDIDEQSEQIKETNTVG